MVHMVSLSAPLSSHTEKHLDTVLDQGTGLRSGRMIKGTIFWPLQSEGSFWLFFPLTISKEKNIKLDLGL